MPSCGAVVRWSWPCLVQGKSPTAIAGGGLCSASYFDGPESIRPKSEGEGALFYKLVGNRDNDVLPPIAITVVARHGTCRPETLTLLPSERLLNSTPAPLHYSILVGIQGIPNHGDLLRLSVKQPPEKILRLIVVKRRES